MQIKSVEIQNPHLTSTLPRRLTDAFNSLPQLQEIAIVDPIALHSLPRPTSADCLKIIRLSEVIGDWQWVTSLDDLQEIEVSFTGDKRIVQALHIDKNKAFLTNINNEEIARSLVTLMSHLPECMKSTVNVYYLHFE